MPAVRSVFSAALPIRGSREDGVSRWLVWRGLLDRDGVYGAPRFYGPAAANNLRARVGAEITMEDGSVVPLLVVTRQGYQNLCQLITEAKLVERKRHTIDCGWGALTPPRSPWRGEGTPPTANRDLPDPTDRKRPCYATWSETRTFLEGLIALTGDEEGPVRRAWLTQGATSAGVALEKTFHDLRPRPLYVELQRHRLRGESAN